MFAPNSKTETYIEQMRLFAEQPAETVERDLLVFSLFDQEPGRWQDRSISVAAAESARENFKVAKDSFAVLLIGKDGGVKLQSQQPVSPTDIFDLIDTMPMRQREMQEQQAQSKIKP